MIIRSRHNIFIYSFFRFYTTWKIKRNFSRVILSGTFTDLKKPVLLISNHISWWDGFWVMYLNLKLLRRIFNFMMLEEQLEKFWFFKYTGGFSVKKGTRSVIETIDHARELLRNPANLVLIFPQGEIQSIYRQDFRFEKGVERILIPGQDIQIVFNVNLIEYFSDSLPSLYIYYREFNGKEVSVAELENAYNSFYKECLDDNRQK